MSSYFVELSWSKTNPFKYDQFSRRHQIFLSGAQQIENSAAKEYLGDEDCTNPEELLAAALASCHMLTFLAIAAKSGYTIEKYSDRAEAVLDKNEEGRTMVSAITLAPQVIFSNDKLPSSEQLKAMHQKAHRNCFIANSIKTKVTII